MNRKRIIWSLAVGVIVTIVTFAGLWLFNGPIAYARIATGFVAQQTCACLHVSDRTEASCRAEFPEDALQQITIDAEADTVRASALGGVISAEAHYEEKFGCSIVD